MKKLFILTFDFFKEGYSRIPYPVSSLITAVKNDKENSFEVVHESINLNVLHSKFNSDKDSIEKEVLKQVKNIITNKCWDVNFIAIGVTAWSEKFVKKLLPFLKNNFKGKIILGGYEITAIDEKTLIEEYPGVDFYIKGYAETPLLNIMRNKYSSSENQGILNEKLEMFSLKSPYLYSTIPLSLEKKVYWETKRGCPYKCGFCEWGNALQKDVQFFSYERLKKEIQWFKREKVKSINILDGTFNFGEKENYNYVEVLKMVLDNTSAKINFQTRFENISFEKEQGVEFLKVCEKYKQRITMEFGLQTVHENEMDIIGRKNNIPKIETVMKFLNEKDINYELSIIYGIPGQTIDSFLETIEFILNNGCEKICAYPLRIPRNSIMEKEKEKLGVMEDFNVFNISFVKSSYSFSQEEYEKMSNFTEVLKGLNSIKSLFNDRYNTNFIIMEYQTDGSYKLIELTKQNRLFFNALNEKFYNMLSGYEEIILKLIISQEAQYVFDKVLRLFPSTSNKMFQLFSKGIEFLLKTAVWHYQAEDGKKYLCSLKISKQGNIYILKDYMELNERLFFLN